ncbi:hypothetical protein XI03_20390 [Bradyrhizobium sp. CCBAU 65884]|nr:hypothetical protein [Bradyrhizobium sp. CCBAU 65884]
MLAHVPFFAASSLIQSASQPRSASRIEPGFSGKSKVVGLARIQGQPYRETIAIDHRMDFTRQAAA